MTPVTHDSNEWRTLLEDVKKLQSGQHTLELQMTNIIGSDGTGGLLGTLVTTVKKLDVTVDSVNQTMIGWKAILQDRKDRSHLWYPIIAVLLAAIIGLLGAMWASRPGRAALGVSSSAEYAQFHTSLADTPRLIEE